MITLTTLQELRDYLNGLTEEQLKQPVQAAKPTPNMAEPVEMQPAIAIGTMDKMEFYGARSVTNNRFNPEEIVFLLDYNPFGEDGNTGTIFEAGELGRREGETSEERMDRFWNGGRKVYGPDGPTPKEAQLNPKQQAEEDLFDVAWSVKVLENRVKGK